MIKLADVLEGRYTATTFSQGVVIGHLQQLAQEAGDLSTQYIELREQLNAVESAMATKKAVVQQLLEVLDDLPDASFETLSPPKTDG